MDDRAIRAQRRYETTLDRVGLAIAAGAALGGAVVVLLVLLDGRGDLFELIKAWLIGTMFVGLGITAVAGPLWLVLHVAGLRRPLHAALVGAIVTMAVCVSAQTWGFGLDSMPTIDEGSLVMRWVSAILTSLGCAGIAALIGLAMWRIAYRRVE